MLISEISEHLEYIPSTGDIFVLKDKVRYRKLLPNEEHMVITNVNSIRLKIKYDRLVWCLVHNYYPTSTEVVFHKDLDIYNNRLNNLILITKKEYFVIQESLKNLSGNLKITPHSRDAFSYVLEYKYKGRIKREVISDITIARKKFTKLQLKFIKVLGKYTISQ
jgi:hypothetical protein